MIASPPSPPSQAFGGFAVRTVAYLIDAILLSLVGGAFPYLLIAGANTSQPSSAAAAAGPGAGGSVLLAVVYFIVFWSFLGGGRTIGMRLMGLRVVHEDGTPVGMLAAIVRVIGLWLSFAACFIGVLWVAGDSRKQGWHDKLARTLVVRV